MIALASALLLAALQAAPAPKPYRDAADLFTRVCTQGGGSFAPETIEAIPAIDVASVRDDVGEQRYNRFYRVTSGRWRAFLIVQDTLEESSPRNTRYCTVATRSIGFGEAVRGVLPGYIPRGWRSSRSTLYVHDSPLGHRIHIERLRGGYVSITSIVPGAEAIRDEDIVVAFRDACDRSQGRYALATKAAALGWEEIPDSAHPALPRLMRTATEGGEPSSSRGFRRVIGGRPVFAVVAEAGPVREGTRCRVYDFDATGPIDPKMVERWMRSNPISVRDLPAGGMAPLLSPDWDKNSSVEVVHVPANSSRAQELGFSGNLLAAQAVGDP